MLKMLINFKLFRNSLAVSLLAAALVVPHASQAEGSIETKVKRVDCGPSGSGIQKAIDSASSGDTIRISGTCREAVQIIKKNIYLIGETGARIEAPDTAWNFAPYTKLHPMILVVNGEAAIQNLIIDGRGKADSGDFSGLMGVYFLNADGEISDTWFTKIRRMSRANDWNVVPVRVVNTSTGPKELEVAPRTVSIERNSIEDFETNGIFANSVDKENAPAPLTVMVRNNSLRGIGTTTLSQNGIQLGGLYSGQYSTLIAEVTNNDLYGFINISGVGMSSAIFVAPFLDGDKTVLRNGSLKIANNRTAGSNIGLTVFADARTAITDNMIQNADLGLALRGTHFLVKGNMLYALDAGILSDGTNVSKQDFLDNNNLYDVSNPYSEGKLRIGPGGESHVLGALGLRH